MNNTKQTRNLWLLAGRVVFTLALVGTMAFIFSNSMAVAEVSNQTSGAVQNQLYALLDKAGLSGLKTLFTVRVIRKLAHLAEYMLLGFWWMLCLRVYTRHFIRHISWPVLACLLTALVDETLQLYSAGRNGSITDLWIDFGGSLAGLVCGLLLLCLCRMIYILIKYRNKE